MSVRPFQAFFTKAPGHARSLWIRWIFFLLLLSLSIRASANFYYYKNFPYSGTQPDLTHMLPGPGNAPAFWSTGDKEHFRLFREQLLKEGHPGNDFRFQADLAFCDHVLGDSSAFGRLFALQASHPEEYNLAANLSLLYEQKKDYARSLELARKAQSLFPAAWFGSPVLNVRIQELHNRLIRSAAEITGLNNARFDQWLDSAKAVPSGHADTLLLRLAWTLHLRTALFPAPDSITAQLLNDFADLVAKTNTRSTAKPFYNAILLYAPQKKDLVESRIILMDASEKEVRKTFRWAALVWAIPILALLVAFTGNVMNKRKKQRTG